MRIHRLRLEDVRGVTSAELTFPETAVTVIEGPNEVGKSTMLEALDRLLDPKAKASSKAATIVCLQPVGRDVGPFVEAELSIGPYRLIFAKRWLKQHTTTLQILQPAVEQLTGQDAQARMTGILDACLDRTLFDALRLAQAGSPGAIALGDSAVLEAALDAAAGAELHSQEGLALLDAVEREYQRYYTAGTGRVSGELREAQTAVTEGEQLQEQAEYDVREVEELFQRREVLRQELLASEQSTREASAAAQAADAALARVTEMRAHEQAEQRALLAAEQLHRRALTDVELRQRLRDDVCSRSAEVDTCREEVDQLEGARAQRAGELQAREIELERAREECAKVRNKADRAAAELSLRRHQLELTELADRIEAAEVATHALRHIRTELEAYAVSAAVLEELRSSDAELGRAQARVEAGATEVRVSAPVAGHSVEISEEPEALDPGHEVIERLVSSEVSLLLDSHVRVEIRADARARGRLEHRDRLHQVLSDRLEELGLSGMAEAEEAGRRRAAALGRTRELEQDLARALQGRELAELQKDYEAREAELSAVAGVPCATASEAHGSLQRAVQRAEASRRAVPSREDVRDSAQQAADAARARHAQTAAALEVRQAQHGSALVEQARAVTALAEARALEDDDVLAAHVGRCTEQWDQVRESLHKVRTCLAAEGAAAREKKARDAAAELSRATAHLQSVREQFFEVKGSLEQVTAEGRQETLERAAQRVDDARRRYASVMRRATAAAHLRDTLRRHRERAHRSYAEPYAGQVERLGQQIYGESFGVTVSSDLVITHRQLHGDSVPFESLSGGAREQLGILARLAVAALVADHQAVPVVVDDALGYTDPQRLRSLGTVLAQGGSESQLLLLTCTPERYADIPGAQTIRMTA